MIDAARSGPVHDDDATPRRYLEESGWQGSPGASPTHMRIAHWRNAGHGFLGDVFRTMNAMSSAAARAASAAVAVAPVAASISAGACRSVVVFQAKYSLRHAEKFLFFHYVKRCFLDQSIQKAIQFYLENRSTCVAVTTAHDSLSR